MTVREYWVQAREGTWHRLSAEQFRAAEIGRALEICEVTPRRARPLGRPRRALSTEIASSVSRAATARCPYAFELGQ